MEGMCDACVGCVECELFWWYPAWAFSGFSLLSFVAWCLFGYCIIIYEYEGHDYENTSIGCILWLCISAMVYQARHNALQLDCNSSLDQYMCPI